MKRVLVDPALVEAWILVASIGAFSLCVADKARAARGGRRVRERTLLGAALVGGTPGLVVGMILVRHKTRKVSFLVKLGGVIVTQAIVLWALARWT